MQSSIPTNSPEEDESFPIKTEELAAVRMAAITPPEPTEWATVVAEKELRTYLNIEDIGSEHAVARVRCDVMLQAPPDVVYSLLSVPAHRKIWDDVVGPSFELFYSRGCELLAFQLDRCDTSLLNGATGRGTQCLMWSRMQRYNRQGRECASDKDAWSYSLLLRPANVRWPGVPYSDDPEANSSTACGAFVERDEIDAVPGAASARLVLYVRIAYRRTLVRKGEERRLIKQVVARIAPRLRETARAAAEGAKEMGHAARLVSAERIAMQPCGSRNSGVLNKDAVGRARSIRLEQRRRELIEQGARGREDVGLVRRQLPSPRFLKAATASEAIRDNRHSVGEEGLAIRGRKSQSVPPPASIAEASELAKMQNISLLPPPPRRRPKISGRRPVSRGAAEGRRRTPRRVEGKRAFEPNKAPALAAAEATATRRVAEKEAVAIIQSKLRVHIALVLFVRLRRDQKAQHRDAALKIQSRFKSNDARRCILQLQQEDRRRTEKLAARTIQCKLKSNAARRCVTSLQLEKRAALEKQAALTIQSRHNGNKARRYVHQMTLEKLKDDIRLDLLDASTKAKDTIKRRKVEGARIAMRRVLTILEVEKAMQPSAPAAQLSASSVREQAAVVDLEALRRTQKDTSYRVTSNHVMRARDSPPIQRQSDELQQ